MFEINQKKYIRMSIVKRECLAKSPRRYVCLSLASLPCDLIGAKLQLRTQHRCIIRNSKDHYMNHELITYNKILINKKHLSTASYHAPCQAGDLR